MAALYLYFSIVCTFIDLCICYIPIWENCTFTESSYFPHSNFNIERFPWLVFAFYRVIYSYSFRISFGYTLSQLTRPNTKHNVRNILEIKLPKSEIETFHTSLNALTNNSIAGTWVNNFVLMSLIIIGLADLCWLYVDFHPLNTTNLLSINDHKGKPNTIRHQ